MPQQQFSLAQPEGGALTAASLATLNAAMAASASVPVDTPQLDPTTVQYATVNLTLAQILALHTTPIVLVAAAGAGTLLELISAQIEFVFGSAAFTIGSATNLEIQYNNASGAAASGTLAATGFFDQTASTIAQFEPAALAATAASALLNKNLVLTLAAANMTVGTGGSAIVKVAYRVHSGL